MRGAANVEEQGHLDSRWSTPLAIAARVGRANGVKLLLEHHADIHAHGRTILHDSHHKRSHAGGAASVAVRGGRVCMGH